MKIGLLILGWLLLILFICSALAFLMSLILTSIYRKTNRFERAIPISGGLAVLFLIFNFAYSELHFMNLEEPFAIAAHDGNLPRVEQLYNKGAEINAELDEGGTALFEASRQGHTEVVRFLLAHGANVTIRGDDLGDIQSRYDITPLEAAKKYPEIVALLRAAGAKE